MVLGGAGCAWGRWYPVAGGDEIAGWIRLPMAVPVGQGGRGLGRYIDPLRFDLGLTDTGLIYRCGFP